MQMTSSASATDPAPAAGSAGVIVRHRVPGFSERWILPETTVPEAAWHDDAAGAFRDLLVEWVRRTGRDAAVYRNIAVRMREDRPKVGFDPDVCIVEPAPDSPRDIESIRIWRSGHSVPRFVLEVVSKRYPRKDYTEVPDQCAAAGVSELVVFDPRRLGPRAQGGRRLLSIWRRGEDGSFERTYSGDGPARSDHLQAWLVPTAGGLLRISDDPAGRELWPTAAEAERAAKQAALAEREAERAAKQAALAEREAERAAKEAALTRIAELEAELRKR
jgi:Uma2 family endonuclease